MCVKKLERGKMIKTNPFRDSGIVTYEQFKKHPFLILGNLSIIKNVIKSSINDIEQDCISGERIIIIGDRGAGKTSTLFFIENMLEEANLKSYYFTRLITTREQIIAKIKEDLLNKGTLPESLGRKLEIEDNNLFKEPTFLLIDFPDTVDLATFKKFLLYSWDLMSDKNQENINLIFSMNHSHYDKSYSHSEIFGKFTTRRLDPLNEDETRELIESRLKIQNATSKDIFSEEVLNKIYSYSKGIPRNIVSACSLLFAHLNGNRLSLVDTEYILREEFTEQVINDRVDDLVKRRIYKQIIQVLKNDFNSTAKSKESFVNTVMEKCGIGRNSTTNKITELIKFGILTEYRGGFNNTSKIIALGDAR